jgi:hypothetical protein
MALTENIDYYFNNEGLMVLTEKYLLERGHCCGNGCRHCPYNYENVPEPERRLLLKETKAQPPGAKK